MPHLHDILAAVTPRRLLEMQRELRCACHATIWPWAGYGKLAHKIRNEVGDPRIDKETYWSQGLGVQQGDIVGPFKEVMETLGRRLRLPGGGGKAGTGTQGGGGGGMTLLRPRRSVCDGLCARGYTCTLAPDITDHAQNPEI